ncbi:MAG: hypothetical protein WC604_01965 [Candidatus Gracilibacteria bacterium]
MKNKDDSTIDLSKLGGDDSADFSALSSAGVEDDGLKEVGSGAEEEEFKIHHLELGRVERVSDREAAKLEAFGDGGDVSHGPASKVRVKFDKFITLVATHTYEDILKRNADEDVIISTNLLTDLANAHDEARGDKKLPLLFAFGLIIGVIATWLILRS